MVNVEEAAVVAVRRELAYCPRLSAEIAVKDRTPITDGHVDVYEGSVQTNATLKGRVSVQVKGGSHVNKKVFKKQSTTYQVEKEVLAFFRDNGGGVYFYVAVHPESRLEKIFFAVMNPFKINRIIREMKPGQATKAVPLKTLPSRTSEIERIFDFAVVTRNQDVKLGVDDALIENSERFTLFTTDGVDFSKHSMLDPTKQDFAVVFHTSEGMNIPVDVDMQITPASYIPHESDVSFACGNVEYERSIVRQTGDHSLEAKLSEALTLEMTAGNGPSTITLQLSQHGSVRDQFDAVRFFIAASDGNPITVNGDVRPITERPQPASKEDRDNLKGLQRLMELFEKLSIDAAIVEFGDITPEQYRMLQLMYAAIVQNEALHAESGRAGRFDLAVGPFMAILMAVRGDESNHWRFFDPCAPANRSEFRLYTVSETGESEETDGTIYEALSAHEVAIALNLRLGSIPSAYEEMGDRSTALILAQRTVLKLVGAADQSHLSQRSRLLTAAETLNEWIIGQDGELAVHLVNRWQIIKRVSTLSAQVLDEIRALRRGALRAKENNADLLYACTSILLGDDAEVRAAIGELEEDRLNLLRTWPIWSLASPLAADAGDLAD